jgi:tRNA threonylcarbamoyladenosine biosynthesis protein TsaE
MESFLRKKFRLYKKYASTGPAKTADIAGGFSKLLKQGAVIGLLGGLGAGKTHFIKGAAEFFGFKSNDVVSPTFNLVKEYKKAGVALYHFDLYRLKNADELDKIGYRDYISQGNAVTFIEWPDRIKETWGDLDWVVEIKHKGKNKRQICIYKKAKSHKP